MQVFYLVAGTLTGGIIAIGLAMGLPARRILELYESRGPGTFSQHRKWLPVWAERRIREMKRYVWGSKYDSNKLRSALAEILGDRKIGDARTRLMIPAWHPLTGEVHVFKTAHHERLRTDYKELARDAAMATASAPTYFRELVTARDVGLVDAGSGRTTRLA